MEPTGKNSPIAFCGGDARMIYAAERLLRKGYDVCFAAKDAEAAEKKLIEAGARIASGNEPDRADVRIASAKEPGKPEKRLTVKPRDTALKEARELILPLPVTRDGIAVFDPLIGESPPLCEVISSLPPGAAVFCGMATKLVSDAARDARVTLTDYYADEGFLIRNAALTAEGAIAELIRLLPRSLSGAYLAVFGYGRCASQLSRRLIALGARVSVVARSADKRAAARADGADAAVPEDAPEVCLRSDAAINTVPAPVIGLREAAALAEHGAFVLELADRPGVSEDAAGIVQTVRAAGLPGRFSPASAGELIADAVSAATGGR